MPGRDWLRITLKDPDEISEKQTDYNIQVSQMAIGPGSQLATPPPMARHRVILQSEFPYNITARCINREWFHLPLEYVWDIFCKELKRTHEDHSLVIHSFVLMSNHFHLIASTPKANISQCTHQFMTRVSRKLTRAGNRINETFAGRHYKTILQSPNYFLNAYKYNYRNPVEANICPRVEDYSFSTLQILLGKKAPLFPLEEDTTFNDDPVGTMKWLNTKPEENKLEAVKFGLKRQYFRSKIDRKTRKPILGEEESL